MFGGTIFDGRNEILLLDKALKFREIFQKCININKNLETLMRKCVKTFNFSTNFLIFTRDYIKDNEYNIGRL